MVHSASSHGRMARGGHGLPKVSPWPAMPYPSRPAGGPPLKRFYGCFRGRPPTKQAACNRLLPFWTPHAVRQCFLLILIFTVRSLNSGFQQCYFFNVTDIDSRSRRSTTAKVVAAGEDGPGYYAYYEYPESISGGASKLPVFLTGSGLAVMVAYMIPNLSY
jgi:hypothetical protein